MIIAHAFLVAIAASSITEGETKFQTLTSQLAHEVEWIDMRGSKTVSNQTAKDLLNKLIRQMKDPQFKLRHQSKWKKDQCFKILHISSKDEGYRVYFQCEKGRRGNMIVTRVKLNKL